MAQGKVSKYTIQLDIEQSDKTRAVIDDIERSLKSIGDATRDGLADGLNNATKEAETLAKRIKDIAKSEGDSTKELEAFDRAANKAIGDLEKQSIALRHSLSEQGKAQRERLEALQKERSELGKTAADRKRAKEIDKEIKAIRKDIVVGTDEELKSALEKNKSIRLTLKLSQQEAKLTKAKAKDEKTLSALVKSDIKSIREKIKEQLKFIQALKTTEGKYKAIKKAAGIAAKGAGIVGAGLVGGAMALGGMAISSANSQVDREREANRIKASISDDEKNAMLGELYVKTGADYTTIVDAINRVTSVLGVSNRDDIAQAAVAEIRFPGAAAMFRQQNTGAASASDFNVYANRIKAIQGQTGASVSQIQESTNKIANLRQSNFSNASETDLLAIYSALQGSGAYDTQEELDRAFNSFLRAKRGSKDNIFDFAEKYFTQKSTQTRGVYGATNKQQAMQALSMLNWSGIRGAAATSSASTQMTAAETTAEKMRQIEEIKNEVLIKLLKALEPVIKSIDIDELSSFFDAMLKLAKELAPAISALVSFVTTTMVQLVSVVSKIFDFLFGDEKKLPTPETGIAGQAHANGGIASIPSLCGERGPEMVIPLDYSRSARRANLTQNLVQNFNMAGNETTALSLSQAVKSRDFTRAMMNSTWLSGRLGR